MNWGTSFRTYLSTRTMMGPLQWLMWSKRSRTASPPSASCTSRARLSPSSWRLVPCSGLHARRPLTTRQCEPIQAQVQSQPMLRLSWPQWGALLCAEARHLLVGWKMFWGRMWFCTMAPLVGSWRISAAVLPPRTSRSYPTTTTPDFPSLGSSVPLCASCQDSKIYFWLAITVVQFDCLYDSSAVWLCV